MIWGLIHVIFSCPSLSLFLRPWISWWISFVMILRKKIGVYRPLKVKIILRKVTKIAYFLWINYAISLSDIYACLRHAQELMAEQGLVRSSQWKLEQIWENLGHRHILKLNSSHIFHPEFEPLNFEMYFFVMKLRKEWGVPTPDSRDFNLINFHDNFPSQFHFEIMRKAEGFNYHSKMTFWSFKIRHLRHLNLQKSKNSTYWQTNTSIQDWGVQITESSIR